MRDDDYTVRVENGQIIMRLDGAFGRVNPLNAWAVWLNLQDSPIAASRDRAEKIRQALDEIGYLK